MTVINLEPCIVCSRDGIESEPRLITGTESNYFSRVECTCGKSGSSGRNETESILLWNYLQKSLATKSLGGK